MDNDFKLRIKSKNVTRLIGVDDQISKELLPHQLGEIQSMCDSYYESMECKNKTKRNIFIPINSSVKSTSYFRGNKIVSKYNLYSTALLHSLLVNRNVSNVRRCLVLLQVKNIENWKEDYLKWTNNCSSKPQIYDIVQRQEKSILADWYKNGGILIIDEKELNCLVSKFFMFKLIKQ